MYKKKKKNKLIKIYERKENIDQRMRIAHPMLIIVHGMASNPQLQFVGSWLYWQRFIFLISRLYFGKKFKCPREKIQNII